MSTNAERQRKRRERLRKQGIVDVTVPVPQAHKKTLRQFAQGLRDGSPMAVGTGPLFEVIKALKSVRPQLEKAGVKHAGVFGGAARGEYRLDSDIDILVDIDVKRIGDIVTYIKIADSIKEVVKARCPEVEVDVADHATLKPRIRKRVERDVLYAF